MKNSKEIEEKLLSDNSLNDLINKKLEEEVLKEMEESKQPKELIVIEDFSQVPEKKVFSKQTIYKVFNRKHKTENYLNGIQTDGLIGIRKDIRNNLLAKNTDNFSVNDYYVKFFNYTKEI